MTSREVLLQAVADFLKLEVQAELEGVHAYKNRIANNLLQQLLREEMLATAVAAVDSQLARQLGQSLPTNAELSRELRDGKLTLDHALLETLRHRTMLQMAIDNPRYSGYREALARWPELAGRIATASTN